MWMIFSRVHHHKRRPLSWLKTSKPSVSQGGFNFTKWLSNSRKVLSAIPEEHRATTFKELDLDRDELPVERVLGLQWCTDVFKFKFGTIDKPHTRRSLLSLINSVYDLLFFIKETRFLVYMFLSLFGCDHS